MSRKVPYAQIRQRPLKNQKIISQKLCHGTVSPAVTVPAGGNSTTREKKTNTRADSTMVIHFVYAVLFRVRGDRLV
jgi:hypothetical protein